MKERFNRDGVLYSVISSSTLFEGEIYRHFSSLLLQIAKQEISLPKKQLEKKRSVAVALIDREERVLVVKRSMSHRVGRGLWQIPGGKAEEGETPTQAAVREIKEELNIDLSEQELNLIHVFPSHSIVNEAQKLDIYFYSVELSKDTIIQLNDENETYEWLDLKTFYLHDKTYLKLNRTMLEVLWRERSIIRVLDLIQKQSSLSDSRALPASLPGVDDRTTWATYSLLSLLGIVDVTGKLNFTSEYSDRILDTFVELSHSNVPLLENGQSNPTFDLTKLRERDFLLLEKHKKDSLYSHKSLFATLSSKVRVKNSTRKVCAVLIFGQYDTKPYILLRWDIFANKYQLICSGIPVGKYDTYKEEAYHVLRKRFGGIAENQFDLVKITDFSSIHFSSGSVENDPIMREYNIGGVVAFARKNSLESIKHVIDSINEATKLCIKYGFATDDEQKISLNYFVWCSLDELMKNQTEYGGRPVQGFNELLGSISKDDLYRFTQNSIPLSENMIDQWLETEET